MLRLQLQVQGGVVEVWKELQVQGVVEVWKECRGVYLYS